MIYNTRNLSNDTTESQKEKLLVLKFFTKTKAFVLIKLFLKKKKKRECNDSKNQSSHSSIALSLFFRN